jgi:hypothetical protein
MENILEIQKYIYNGLYLVLVILAIVRYPRYKNDTPKYFPLLLFLNLIVEYVGLVLGIILGFNLVIYNISNLIYFPFIFLCFRESTTIPAFKKYINVFIVLFIIIFFYFAFATDFNQHNQWETTLTGSVFSIICILLYYISILRSDAVITIRYDRIFWISIGFLLFFAGTIPIEIISNALEMKGIDFNVFGVIRGGLIIIMNVCFIIGLLITRPKSLQVS